MSSAIIHQYMDANPKSEQFISTIFGRGFERIRFWTLKKPSCIAGSDAYDGLRLGQAFLMIHRNA